LLLTAVSALTRNEIVNWWRWPLACCDCGFDSRLGHWIVSRVSAVCFQVEVSAANRSFVQRSSTDCVSSNMVACNNVSLHLQWVGRNGQTKRQTKVIANSSVSDRWPWPNLFLILSFFVSLYLCRHCDWPLCCWFSRQL